MGEQPPFAGLGKLYFCRVEDVEKDPKEEYFALDKPVSLLEPGMLTYKDDDEKPSYATKGLSATFTGTMEEPGEELLQLLLTPPNRWDVKLEQKPGRMPRKMKKAYCHGWLYRRDTKWKRKAGNYRRRLLVTLHNAEIVVTKEQRDRLASTIEMTISGKPE